MTPPTPSYEERILRSLRRLARATDRFNREMVVRHQLTAPQAVCLRALLGAGALTPGALSKEVSASQATVTGILDRLEARGLVGRVRDAADRRRVIVTLTDEGLRVARTAPLPLHTSFLDRLTRLAPEERASLDAALGRLVEMMEDEPGPDAGPVGRAG